MEIHPSRVTLRPFELTDVDDFFSWGSDDDFTRHLRWKSLTAREQALTTIKEVYIPHPWRRSMCIDNRSIGFVSVSPESRDDGCRAYFAYGVAKEYCGRGIASAAVKMALARVFEDLPGVVRLQAFVDVNHKASQRVLEKAGFAREGLLRKYTYLKGNLLDMFIYSFLSTDAIPCSPKLSNFVS